MSSTSTRSLRQRRPATSSTATSDPCIRDSSIPVQSKKVVCSTRKSSNGISKSKVKQAKKPNNLVPIIEVEVNEETIYEKETAYLKQLVQSLLEQNKANSVIICGDAGFGKNHLIETCLDSFPVIRNKPDSKFGHLNVLLFELDGNLHGKKELSTLRIIGRRLSQLLKNSSQFDISDIEEEEVDDDQDNSELDLSTKLANSIPKIMAEFQYLIEHRPNFRCIIILDNFEVFSYRQQYLLYNLFDLIQKGRSVLIAGLTRRLDCIQLLTSRVQSRLNRRMIHLITPFKSLESYIQFCSNYSKQISGKNACQIDKKEMEKAFSLNRSFSELKRLVQEYSFVPKQVNPINQIEGDLNDANANATSALLHADPKIVDLSNLTRNELIILVIVSRNLRNQEAESFTCKQLHDWATQMPQIKTIRFDQVMKCIYKMIELDLLVITKETRSQSSKTAQLWITPWTLMMLNISQFQLKQLLEALGNKIPAYIKQIMS